MLIEALQRSAAAQPSHLALVIGGATTSWHELKLIAQRLQAEHQRFAGRRVALRFAPVRQSFALLFALEAMQADAVLLDSRMSQAEAEERGRESGAAALLSPEATTEGIRVQELPDEAQGSGLPTVTILTSGSTGRPKSTVHTWTSLSRPVRRVEADGAPRWLQTYRPSLYAGLQVFLQCMANGGTLYVPLEQWTAAQTAHFIADYGVECVSGTPSWWRRLLLFSTPEVLKRVQLRQITLGGEAADQEILNGLRICFPTARIVHIYATTELGRCFAVGDGREGFPARFLDEISTDGVEMRVVQDELLVRSANSMVRLAQSSSDDDWIATGDLVEIDGDRVLFRGRKTEIINVGGNKVHPLEVERVIRSVAGVADVRVFGRRSSVAGQLVACELVSDGRCHDEDLQQAVLRTCHANLAAHQWPRLLSIVERIALSPAQKMVRGGLRA